MPTNYREVKDEVLNRIRSSVWPPGSNLPGEIDLAEEFGCARATVNRAIRELVEDGVLDRRRKAGTWVKAFQAQRARIAIPLIREEIEETGADYRHALVERELMPPPGWLRAQAGMPRETEVLHLRCMHFADNRPYQLEDRWIDLATVPEARNRTFEEESPNEWLVREIPFSDLELSFSATNATRDIADFLDIAQGDAVFTVQRTTWVEDRTITHARLYFPRGYKMTVRA